MSETKSSPTDWAKFYQQNLSAAAATPNASTGMMISSTNLSSPYGSAPSSSSNLSPNTEGRVSKPPRARRRSRASRRTPTTLLNTDTTNFRAMVQQFTGGSTAPFAATPPSQSFGFNPNPNHTSSVMFSQGYYRLQYQPQGYMISMSNVNSLGAAGEGYFQRLGRNPRPSLQPPEGSDGFLTEMNNASSSSSSSSRVPSSSNENRGNGFMF